MALLKKEVGFPMRAYVFVILTSALLLSCAGTTTSGSDDSDPLQIGEVSSFESRAILDAALTYLVEKRLSKRTDFLPERDLYLQASFGVSHSTPAKASNDRLPVEWLSKLQARSFVAGICENECKPRKNREVYTSFSKPSSSGLDSADVALSIHTSTYYNLYHLELSRDSNRWIVKDAKLMYAAKVTLITS